MSELDFHWHYIRYVGLPYLLEYFMKPITFDIVFW